MARRTPVYEAHRGLDPRWNEFSGWEMPLSYRSIAEEHRAVREHCGLFDVSHMGEIEIRGPEAGAVCQALTVNDVRRLAVGDGQYTLLCNERGGVLDDLILFRLGVEHYLLVVNAANTASDLAWIRERAAWIALRARRARHSPSRSGAAAPRKRHGREHHSSRGRARVGREARQGRVRGSRGAGRPGRGGRRATASGDPAR